MLNLGAGEIAQSAKGLPCKHKDLSLHPPNPYENPGTTKTDSACKLRAASVRDRWIPEVNWQDSLADSISFRVRERLSVKN